LKAPKSLFATFQRALENQELQSGTGVIRGEAISSHSHPPPPVSIIVANLTGSDLEFVACKCAITIPYIHHNDRKKDCMV